MRKIGRSEYRMAHERSKKKCSGVDTKANEETISYNAMKKCLNMKQEPSYSGTAFKSPVEDAYNTFEFTIFIPVDITENVVKLVARKLLGILRPVGTYSEALQGWYLKSGEDERKICISVEIFVNWIANNNPPCTAYCPFMSGRLIALDKQPGIHPVGVGETWR